MEKERLSNYFENNWFSLIINELLENNISLVYLLIDETQYALRISIYYNRPTTTTLDDH